jgi:hypothetical protein
VTKPLLLIDVDGVLNPTFGGKESKGWVKHKLMGYNVSLNRQHGDWLNALSEHFELVWATTWNDDANKYIGPNIGLPKLPVAFMDTSASVGPLETWKLPSVKAYVGDRPFAWIDDDIHHDVGLWSYHRKSPMLPMKIDPRMGLQKHHIKKLEDFAKEVADDVRATG